MSIFTLFPPPKIYHKCQPVFGRPNIAMLKVWKECDMKVIKYYVEAADNAKFLTVIEKSSHAIYLEVNLSDFHFICVQP